MPMRAFFLILASLLVLCVPRAGWAAQAATQDPRSTIQKISTPEGAETKDARPDAPLSVIPKAKVSELKASGLLVEELPSEPPLEFQAFVSQASGRSLPLFGRDFFSRAPASFSPVEEAALSGDYVIAPGDEILIRAWGQVEIDYRSKVDRAGNINIPKVGVLHVAGTEYRQLNSYLRTAIGRVFRNFELNVSLGELRSVQVFLVGHARFPGSYSISPMSTLLSALFATGGPSNKGSLRRIYVRRNNQLIAEFDLYDFLLRGDKSKDIRLLSGDVIQVLPVGPLVALMGSVNTQAIFELKKGESLAHVLESAGGMTTTAAGQRVTLERIVERSLRKIEEFTLDPDGLARPVRDGDIVRVYAISPKIENVVTLRGNVAMPANVPWRKGMRISDLIPERAALLRPEYWVARNQAMGLKIDKESDFKPRVTGEVNWAYAVVERMHPVTQAVTLIPFNLAKAVLQREPAANLLLMPGDVVTVFGREDIRQPEESHDRFVRLEGEVQAPGLYRLLPGETVRQLIKRLGGLTPNAYLFGTELTRVSARAFQQARMTELIARLDVQMEFENIVTTRNSSSGQDVAESRDGEVRRRFLAALGGLQASGRVLMNIDPKTKDINSIPDVPLEDGDRLFFPPRAKVVTVVGAVHRESSVSFQESLSLSDYIARAGGEGREADSSAIYVQRADGSIWSRKQSMWPISSVTIMPGDTIVVPYETDRTLWRKFLRDWGQIFYQFGIGIAAVNAMNK